MFCFALIFNAKLRCFQSLGPFIIVNNYGVPLTVFINYSRDALSAETQWLLKLPSSHGLSWESPYPRTTHQFSLGDSGIQRK